MAHIRFNPWVLVVASLVTSGDALGWFEPRLAQTGLQIATPPSAILLRTADSRTAPDPGSSNDSDEVPDITQHPAASTEGDEVPTALAPRNPEPSSAAPQSATSSSGDEVSSPVVVPDAVGALTSKPRAGAASEVTPIDAVNPPTAVAPAAAPIPVIADADAPIASQLRDALQGDTAKIALQPFYSARNYSPLWITDGKVNERARAAMAYLASVDADGLDPADYPVPNFASLPDPAALADAEIQLSVAVTNYAHHAQVGRVHWTRVSGDIFYDLKPFAPPDVLANLASANEITAALAGYEPQTSGYQALKAKLAELRTEANSGMAAISYGPVLTVGMEDARIPQLRERLGTTGEGQIFDKALADAVKKFQRDNNLKATGVLTAVTVDQLNGRPSVGLST